MFSGIVEEIGWVVALEADETGGTLRIRSRLAAAGLDTKIGDSIALNGTCLTVIELHDDGFTVGLQPVTLRLTNIGDLEPDSTVNLERALAVGGRLGGHYVQGHIDGTGRLVSLTQDGEAVIVRFEVPPETLRYVVQRGFIAVDGISLTVMDMHDDGFSVSLVDHTQQETTLAGKRVGERVNLEIDVIAKYVERLVAPHLGPAA